MSVFKLPLSGDVSQWITPITSWWSGNTISVNLGESGSPEAEAEILRRVGSYGRQLGKITDAMIVLLDHLPQGAKLTQEEKNAIAAFKKMADQIADIKETHKRPAMRP
jgi:ABC-type Fe3+-hydroxamate transport system substrate-binding protein